MEEIEDQEQTDIKAEEVANVIQTEEQNETKTKDDLIYEIQSELNEDAKEPSIESEIVPNSVDHIEYKNSLDTNEITFGKELQPIKGLSDINFDPEVTFDDEDAESKKKHKPPRVKSSIRQIIAESLMKETSEIIAPETKKKSKRRSKTPVETAGESAQREARESFYELLQEAGETTQKPSQKEYKSHKVESEDDQHEEGEESSASESVEFIDRGAYYKLHEELTNTQQTIKLKNNFLQHKLGEYYRKKKMEHVLKEEQEISQDTLVKYQKKLTKLAELYEIRLRETARINQELEELVQEKNDKNSYYEDLFNKMTSKEKETGIGLIISKTGKQIPDKTVDNLIRRQTAESKKIAKLRLKYIILRDLIAERQQELKTLDNIGKNLSLMDYEQLKIENRANADKLEERDEELVVLRVKCKNAIQIMAHIREKSAALEADMEDLKDEFSTIYMDYMTCREKLNSYKTAKDVIRNKTEKLKAESGLLTKKKLLIDMECSLQETKTFSDMLAKLKEEYQLRTNQLRILRKNITLEMMAIENSKKQLIKPKLRSSSNLQNLKKNSGRLSRENSKSRSRSSQKLLENDLDKIDGQVSMTKHEVLEKDNIEAKFYY